MHAQLDTWPGASMLMVASRVPSPYRLNSLVKERPILRRGEEEGDEKGGSQGERARAAGEVRLRRLGAQC